jgi:hypothetical protein
VNLTVHPMTIKAATAFVRDHHRHSRPPVGGLFAVGVSMGEQIVGVGIAGRPVARMLCDGWTVEIVRVCTQGAANACSMLYGALCRAAKALGYRKVVTYTLETEPGTSLRASGFTRAADVRAEDWSRPSRPRLPGLVAERVRWERELAA